MLRGNHPVNHLRKLGPVATGFAINLKDSPSFRLHLAADILAAGLGVALRISPGEWLALSNAAVLKATAELLNTSVEEITDKLWQDHNEQAKRIKDSAAAGVFATILGSFLIWGFIFIPRLLRIRGGK